MFRVPASLAESRIRRAAVAAIVFLVIIAIPVVQSARRTVPKIGVVEADLTMRPVYFNKPDRLYTGQVMRITAVLSAQVLSLDAIASNFPSQEGPASAAKSVALQDYVVAKLSAPDKLLKIDPREQSARAVGTQNEITFVWYVEALQEGEIPVDLEIFTGPAAQADKLTTSVNVLHDRWLATSSLAERLKAFIAAFEPIRQELWTLIGGVGAAITFFGLGRRRPAKTGHSS